MSETPGGQVSKKLGGGMKKITQPANDHDIYRTELRQKRERVLRSLGMKFETLAGMGRVAEDDQAQISHEEFISLRRNTHDYAQLRLVEEALRRLEGGEFGTCQNCGEPIASKRLRALPWAKFCLICQDLVREEADQVVSA
jgi:DnaK suppressor protein